MALRKQIIEMPAMDGLQQKTAAQRLQPGKSAKAINLQKNKQGRLEKRLGLLPLTVTDPFGSGFTMTTGVQLGTWSDGVGPDNLIAIGRGNRPGAGASPAGVLQMYSDDLGGPKMTGYGPELTVSSDNATSASQGSTFSPCQASIGDYVLQVWIDPAYNFSAGFAAGTDPQVQPPLPPVGPIYWSLSQVSTGQTVIAASILDTTALYCQCVRVAAVGTTFVICYSAAGTSSTPQQNNGKIFAKTATLSGLLAGGTVSPAPTSAGTTIVSNNAAVINPYGITSAGPVVTFFNSASWAMPGGYFDMQAVDGDSVSFVLAYATGTFTLGPRSIGGQWTGANIVVDKRPVGSPATLTAQWVVEAIPGTTTAEGGFGLRASNNTNQVAVAWAYWDTNANSYRVKAAIGNYNSMTQLNSSVVIYTAFDSFETAPGFLALNRCTQINSPNGYVVSHSPLGSCWNAAFSTTTALGVVGVGASAHAANLNGKVISVYTTTAGSGNITSTPVILITSANGKGAGATATAAMTSDGYSGGHYVGGITVTAAGSGYTKPALAVAGGASFGSPGFDNYPVLTCAMLYSLDDPSQIILDSGGSNYSSTNLPTVVVGMGGSGSGAVITANVGAGGAITSFTVSNGGSGYDPNNPPVITVIDTNAGDTGASDVNMPGFGCLVGTPVINGSGHITSVPVLSGGLNYSGVTTNVYVSGGASFSPVVSNGQVTGFTMNSAGHNYPSPPTITIQSPNSTTPLYQSSTHRLGGIAGDTTASGGNQLWYPSNNARIVQSIFEAASFGNPIAPFSFLSGGTSIGQYPINTSGVTLASNGLEANGIVYYLGWIPSLTQGSYVVLAFDLACATNITASGSTAGLNGTVFPMRPVGVLQKQTALADPGWGFQAPTGTGYGFLSTLVIQSPSGPNCWTGGSNWGATGDNYGTHTVSYVTSSQGARLSPALGAIQFAPAQGFYTAKFGNLTGISGALPSFFDGQNVMEQSFLYAPESILASLYKDNGNPITGGLTWNTDTDSYTWIFTWEHFDAQGNFHISSRAAVTITGQDILDAYGPGTLANSIPSLPYTGGVEFRIPTLGVTNRQWPAPVGGTSQPSWFGNDLRAYAQLPSSPVTLGVYRTIKNEETYFRVYDRYYNGDDVGSNGFTLLPPVNNTFFAGSAAGATGQVCCVEYTDSLADSFLEDPANDFPLLYGDGTNGNPGSLDNYSPPASNVICRHKERLFIADGNLVMFTKQRGELSGPGYNTTVNSIYVGGDDPITGLASMDDKLIVFKQNQIYYISGDGPADDGTGSNFSDPQAIPTDAGCIWTGSVIATPEGVYFMSDAGLRLVTRSLSVEYVGGPVEDEFSTYPIVTGATLYPANNKVIFLAGQSDVGGGADIVGEVLVRDYVLDAWTTTQFDNLPRGFISTAVAYTNGTQGTWNTAPGYAWHVLMSTGQILRERNPADSRAYYDDKFNGVSGPFYVQSTWLSAPIVMQDLARFRAWDFQVWGTSLDPHQIVISTSLDYGTPGLTKTYPWSVISPTGAIPPITQIRSYDGRMGEAFQVQVQDVSDPASSTGQGFQVLGLSVTTGAYPGQYKLPPGSTK